MSDAAEVRSTSEETRAVIEASTLLSTDEVSLLVGDRTLAKRCLGCTLLQEELKSSDAERASMIVDDVLSECPYTSGYMGAVVTACLIDSRYEQDKLNTNKDLYRRGIY